MPHLPKIIAILGPTASGKTDLGIKLAQEFNGEIISADSRQVYKYMDIATAKPSGQWAQVPGNGPAYLVHGVPHYLMDCIDPTEPFTVAQWQQQAVDYCHSIIRRGKIPFIVGGTGLYFWALIDNLTLTLVAPEAGVRAKLEATPLPELVEQLKKIDPAAAKTVDLNNLRRVARALEAAMSGGESYTRQRTQAPPLFDSLQIGLRWQAQELNNRITRRTQELWRQGVVEEARELLAAGYSPQLPSMSGIGNPEVIAFLNETISQEEAIERMTIATRQYARRQRTWFRREERINWIEGADYQAARTLIEKFTQPTG